MAQIRQLEIPKILYHASYEEKMNDIEKEGLLQYPPEKIWDFSQNCVYLAINPMEALGYAERAGEFQENENWNEYHTPIVLEVNTTNLDTSKIDIDSQCIFAGENENNLPHCFVYYGDIPSLCVKIYSK